MWHLPGSTGQAANSSMICTYLPSLLPTTFSSLLPADGVTFLEDGVTLQLHWQDTANVGHVFTSRCTRIPKKHVVLDILDGLVVFVWKKRESWWVAHWLPSQIRVPLVVTNVSQLHETIMRVYSVRFISYQWYSWFLLFNMLRRWRKSDHC